MTEPLSKEQLDAIRQRADAATPGPWRALISEEFDYQWIVVSTNEDVAIDSVCVVGHALSERAEEDAHFIAAASSDIPALLLYIAALEAEIALLREAIRNLGGDPDQAWYWTDTWQAKEREADEDLRAGRYVDADDTDTLLAD